MLSLFNKCAILSECVAAVFPTADYAVRKFAIYLMRLVTSDVSVNPQHPLCEAFFGMTQLCECLNTSKTLIRVEQYFLTNGRSSHSWVGQGRGTCTGPFACPGVVFSTFFPPTVKTSLNRSACLKGVGTRMSWRGTQLNKVWPLAEMAPHLQHVMSQLDC